MPNTDERPEVTVFIEPTDTAADYIRKVNEATNNLSQQDKRQVLRVGCRVNIAVEWRDCKDEE